MYRMIYVRANYLLSFLRGIQYPALVKSQGGGRRGWGTKKQKEKMFSTA
jgi:hypothetical protein